MKSARLRVATRSSCVRAGIGLPRGHPPGEGRYNLPPVTPTLVLYAGMTVVAALLATWTGCPSLFRLPPEPWRLTASLTLGLALAGLVVLGGRHLEGVAWYRHMATTLKRIVTSPSLLGPELDRGRALVIATYSSVGEEALFRGWLQPWLIDLCGGWLGPGAAATALGIVVAGVLFGLPHLPLMRELRPWTAFAVVIGLLLGVLAWWGQTLAGPVLAHFLINWLNLRRLAAL